MTDKQESRQSALELIEYPDRFPLKVFGHHHPQFEDLVLELVRLRCPQNEHFEISKRASKGGKYTAVTITFTAYSQKQLEDIYRDLYECEHVVMSL
jgi:putative lipoic acid-binding regulatory protein